MFMLTTMPAFNRLFLLANLAASCGAFVPPRAHVGQNAVRTTLIAQRPPLSLASSFDEYDMTDPEQSLAFLDTVVGTGDMAEKGKMVTVAYKGTLLENGEEFDSNDFGISFTLGEGKVIPGWEQGIEGMRVGGKRTLKIPPSLAYGDKGAGTVIPPGSHLQFECELRKVPSGAAEEFLAQSPLFPVMAGLVLLTAILVSIA